MPNPMRFNYFLCLLLFTGFVNFLVTYPATATAPDATSSFVFKADILPYKSLPENFKGSDVLTVFKNLAISLLLGQSIKHKLILKNSNRAKLQKFLILQNSLMILLFSPSPLIQRFSMMQETRDILIRLTHLLRFC